MLSYMRRFSVGALRTNTQLFSSVAPTVSPQGAFQLFSPLRWSPSSGTSELAKNCVLGGTLWGLGDYFAQFICHSMRQSNSSGASSTFSPNHTVTLQTAFFGGCVYTPVAALWYVFMERTFPGKTASMMFKKIACDQTVWATSVLSAVYAYFAVCEGKSGTEAVGRAVSEVPDTLPRNWLVWVPTQAFNILFVPVSKRVWTVNFVTVPWTGYLTWRNERCREETVAVS
eukprot:gnl/TRDRNA2_/TRDRNA2_196004_c0_seq1.p1 gnl/TRDRNA2_/TRDRNA2_196004_c0~~gnl/TRDRNA2_/TRDRNA2_196004_c0_seq1.p1  ORF type:complete len:228 (-),score=18.63 gnl/TRDRNA2_/TRDRNA2_196004_c0_seq1:176-859(-)